MASSNATALPSHSHVYFRYQSGSITLAEWFALLTVCLAPLVTHVAFGYGNVVLLSERRPKLLEQLTQFNPITISWRYYAIVNRRIRARDWDRADMAASNVIFWDGHRWDGSEHLMLQSRQWVTKLPSQSRVNWISSSTLATLAMTAQGIGAAAVLAHYSETNWDKARPGLPTIFDLFALLSFCRLPAFLWLSDENGFDAIKRQPLPDNEEIVEPDDTCFCVDSTTPSVLSHSRPIPLIEVSEVPTLHSFESRLKPNSALGARLWLVYNFVLTASILLYGTYLCITSVGPQPFVIITQLSNLCNILYWLVFDLSAPSIVIYYALKQQGGNTALPCINATWFKWLNVLMMLLALLMFVTNALETKILPNGKTATYPIPPPPR